jgi:hypothetical protein
MSEGTIRIVCAWCKAYMGQKDGQGVQGISLSVCPGCLADLRKMTSKGSRAPSKLDQQRTLASPAGARYP